jgi:sugar phosphate isomerase/epimerase
MVPEQTPSDPLPSLICASHTITGVLPGQVARHGFRERVDAVAKAGFDGLLIHFRDHARLVDADEDRQALRDYVTDAGLRVPAIDFLGDWHDGPGLGSLDQAIETAQLFGASHINVGADLAGQGVPLATLIPAFEQICGRARDAGLGIALELISWGRISTLTEAVALVEAGGEGAGLLLDAWHLAVDGSLDTTALKALDPSLVAGLQISDALPMIPTDLASRLSATQNRLFPGDGGGVNNTGFLTALWPAACRQGVTVEVISPHAAAMTAEHCAAHAAATGRDALKRASALIKWEAGDG